ncbi:MAG: sialate O-acetylesterase [Bacteroidota bacterium]
MKQKLLVLLILSFFSSIAICQQVEKDPIRLFFLGGQSNMDGYGRNSELPDSLITEFQKVWIFHGNPTPDEKENGGMGKWDVLKPGHGVGFSSDRINNNLSDRFGIELSFAKKLQELYPNEKIALIKYSRGGSSIDSLAAGQYGSWEVDYTGTNGINQYDNFLVTIKEALSTNDINDDGKEDLIIPSGIIWMQGESDAAHTEEIANRYYSNLKRLMDLIRASLHTDDLPVVLGKISDSWNNKDGKVWVYGELVQYAQEKYAKTDKNAAIVRSTRYYKYSDPAHYDSNGYIDLGEKFADAVYLLNKK